jgi:hypothetical protein
VAGNRIEDNVPGYAGLPIPGVEARIAQNGELLVRSPGVMLGYWKRPADTREAIEDDGWLHTGDVAEMLEGRLYIRGRIKDILVMSCGEKVPAGDLERAITNDPLFEQALVVGEAKPFVAALVVLEPDAWRALAAGLSLPPEDPSMLRNQRAKRAIIKRIAERLQEFPAHAQVRRVQLLLEPWTIDDGLLTPTMKVKRGEVGRHFSAEIQEFYAGHAIAALPGTALSIQIRIVLSGSAVPEKQRTASSRFGYHTYRPEYGRRYRLPGDASLIACPTGRIAKGCSSPGNCSRRLSPPSSNAPTMAPASPKATACNRRF